MATNKIQDLFHVRGLVAVITGGGSGLGLYAARALDANGAAAVYIVGRREETLKQAASTCSNGSVKYIVGDVSDKDSLQKMVEQIRKEQGFVNFLFANAGIGGPKDAQEVRKKAEGGGKVGVKEFQTALWQADPEEYSKTLHVNVTGAYYTAVAFLDLLDAGNQKRNVPQDSQILVTTSIAGLSRHLASSFAYSTSKAAANHLVKMLATAFAQKGFHIRCNAVAPGLYPSEMTEGSTSKLERHNGVPGHDGAFAGAHIMAPENSPAERTGSEQDLAGLVLFMASQAGAYLNGEVMVTDGGRLAQLPSVY